MRMLLKTAAVTRKSARMNAIKVCYRRACVILKKRVILF